MMIASALAGVVFAVATFHMYAATPQGAAIRAISYNVKKPPIVKRVNIAGKYAAVLTSGGVMESAPVTDPILVQRFSFGWQPLDLLNDRCSLRAHKFDAVFLAQLLRGMPQPAPDPRPNRCFGVWSDSGPRADVEAVRKAMRGPLVPYVIVSRDWAMGSWYGAGGGEDLFRRRGHGWRFVAGGGGAMSFSEVRTHGVPYRDACALHVYDAKCH